MLPLLYVSRNNNCNHSFTCFEVNGILKRQSFSYLYLPLFQFQTIEMCVLERITFRYLDIVSHKQTGKFAIVIYQPGKRRGIPLQFPWLDKEDIYVTVENKVHCNC